MPAIPWSYPNLQAFTPKQFLFMWTVLRLVQVFVLVVPVLVLESAAPAPEGFIVKLKNKPCFRIFGETIIALVNMLWK